MIRKLRRPGMLLLVLIITLNVLGACAPSPGEPTVPAGGDTFPLEVIDQAGRVVSIEKEPVKIVSLAPRNTEILYALGLEENLFGVTEYCDYPEAAKDKPKIGEFSTVDIERIVKIQPDLILATSMHKDEAVPRLEELGFAVLIIQPRTIDEIMETIKLVGRAAGREDRASQLVAEIESRTKAITEKTSALTETQKPKVFYILWHEPLMTVGAETGIHDLIVKAGGINIARGLSGDYPTISLESVVMTNPEVIIAGSGHGAGENLPFEFAMSEPRLEGIDARQNGRIYQVDSDLTNRPGPRMVDGLEVLAMIIHPEIFDQD